MKSNLIHSVLPYPHPTWQSKHSKIRPAQFLDAEHIRSPGGWKVNIGSGSQRWTVRTLNLDIVAEKEVDVLADALELPLLDSTVDSVVCNGVLEHVINPCKAINEIRRILRPGGRLYIEIPFMQTFHASPNDFHRWTSEGIKQLLSAFKIIELHVAAGPASALAWQFQETMAAMFSFRSHLFYRIGLRIFGYLAIPISWLDVMLETNPFASKAASSFSVIAQKE